MDTQSYRRRLDHLLADYRHAALAVKEERANLKEVKKHLQAVEEAQVIVQHAAEQIQVQAHQQIAGVVTKSLATVFEDPYDFRIRFDRRRNRTEATLLFHRDGYDLEDPKNESGVGAIDVAALALRLSCLMLKRPRPRLVLIADEPFKNINGADNRKRAAGLLLSLAKELKVQMIIATGLEWLRIGKVIEIE